MAQALVEWVNRTPEVNRPGGLFVLIGRLTQSAGVTFAVQLERNTDAVFVGESVGAHPNFFNGSMGNHPGLALPGGNFRLRVSTEFEQNSDPLDTRRFLAPDIPVSITFDEYARGDDPVLDAARKATVYEAQALMSDPGGRLWPRYFRWRRETQREAFPGGQLPRRW